MVNLKIHQLYEKKTRRRKKRKKRSRIEEENWISKSIKLTMHWNFVDMMSDNKYLYDTIQYTLHTYSCLLMDLDQASKQSKAHGYSGFCFAIHIHNRALSLRKTQSTQRSRETKSNEMLSNIFLIGGMLRIRYQWKDMYVPFQLPDSQQTVWQYHHIAIRFTDSV